MGNSNNSHRLSYRIGPVEKDIQKNIVPELPVEIWCHIIEYLDLHSLQVCNKIRVISPFIKSIVDSLVKQKEITFKLSRNLIIKAAAENNLQKLKYLHKMGCPLEMAVLAAAIESGSCSLQLAEYCCQYLGDVGSLLYRAALVDFELMKFMKRNSTWSWQSQSIPCFYASQGDLDKLKWVHEQKCPWETAVVRMAVAAGHLHVVKYCYEKGVDGLNSPDLGYYAAMNGHLHVLEYLIKKGAAWGETLSGAAESGRLDIMKWAVDNGCPTNHRRVCYNAAARGSLPCLKYAHEVGCPWDNSVLLVALLNRHADCAVYARCCGLVEDDWYDPPKKSTQLRLDPSWDD